MLQFKTWNWAHTLCYHKRKAQWQQGKNNKKANNLLLLSLLKQNLKFLFGLLKLPSYTRNVITLQARIIRTQKWKRRLCKPLKEKHKRCSVFSKSLLCSSKTGIFFLLSKMLKTEIWLNQTSGSILYILNIRTKELTTWCILQPFPSTFHPPKLDSQINKVKQSCSCANH
jgi:hypothetical protein